MLRVCIENHIPFRVVSEDDLADGIGSEHKVILVGNAQCLTDKTIDALVAFYHAGGGVVTTFLAAMRHTDGTPRDVPGLASIGGVR